MLTRLAFRPLSLGAALLLTLAACENHDHDHDGEDPGAEGCEHLKEASQPTSATAGTAGAPLLSAHTNNEIKLPDGSGGGKRGVVSVMSSKASGTLHVLLGTAVGIAVADASGKEIPAGAMKSGSCPEVKAWYEYPVGVGRYDLTLGGPTNTTANVNVVIEIE